MPTTSILHLTLSAFLLVAAASTSLAAAYTNHTVGDASGWFFNSNTSSAASNYSAWAASQSFSLGDYLIFVTSSNQTVIQTYNVTTFRNCTADEAENDDTFQYYGGVTAFQQSLTIAVPLTIEGTNYYFSDADDRFQCLKGMAFEIEVKHGAGLPASLGQPPPPPYMEPPGPDSAQSPPVGVGGGSNGGWRRGANVRVVVGGVFVILFLSM